ncbi:sigma-70 family RNA polymerase sigma factor [Variovorax sp. PAMC28562]|uniref:sigma-70 family RNA polymerase sigma factor n=1 Tax=Variovorax sp. PAMC28562 TaxID=2762323 RepID=UPI00164D8E69|nr:sigma-70 family RNA polymerase sigma factor [Variovorax sp. PAMC28562]QNK73099.1 sigma-70 family RNA polymerase sigma factor [Variovorax sp. PAMC28562]
MPRITRDSATGVRGANAGETVETVLRDLFLRGLAGDAAAYHAFLSKLGAHLRAFLGKRLFGWPDEVEDLVQECLLAMHNQRHTYQSDQPLTAWVHAIARYKMIDLLRAKSGREALHVPLDDEIEVFAASATDASDARRDLGGLLATLPDRQRLPIVHVKLEGLSVAETSRLIGMSESAVKVNVHRGLKALAARFRSAP